MISKQLNDAIACIALLTQSEQERLIAFMQSPPSVMSEPTATQAKAATIPQHLINRKYKHWTDDEMLLLMQFEEDSSIVSKAEYKRKRRAFAKSIDRSEDAIDRKIWDMRNKRNTQ